MRAVGLFLVFFVPTAIGFLKAYDCSEKNNLLRSFITFVAFIKREVTSYLTPQREIYQKFYDKHLSRCGFLDTLKNDDTDTPFSSALIKEREKLTLDDEVYDLIFEFSTLFGTLSENEESERCDKLISDLEEIYKISKEETREKVRLYRTIGCMAGIAFLLVLW